MKIVDFKKSLVLNEPPTNNTYLKALWLDGKGDWNGAHDIIDHLPGQEAAMIHAYLHRKEGDKRNAQYWYSRAGKSVVHHSLEQEWEELVDYFSTQKVD